MTESSVPAASGAEADDIAMHALDVDGVRAAAIGTLVWVCAGIYCLVTLPDLQDSGRGWWLIACGFGVALGVCGLLFTVRRRAAYRAAHDR